MRYKDSELAPFDTSVILKPYFNTPWGLSKARRDLSDLIVDVRHQGEIAKFPALAYHEQAPRKEVSEHLEFYSWRRDGETLTMPIKTYACAYAYSLFEILAALKAECPINPGKASAAHYAIARSRSEKFRADAKACELYAALGTSTRYSWTEAEMVVGGPDFTQGAPYWGRDKLTGLPELVTACYARVGGLAVLQW